MMMSSLHLFYGGETLSSVDRVAFLSVILVFRQFVTIQPMQAELYLLSTRSTQLPPPINLILLLQINCLYKFF